MVSFDDELPALEQQLAFEAALEKRHASDIGATHASNNLVVLQLHVRADAPAVATQLAGIQTGIPLGKSQSRLKL